MNSRHIGNAEQSPGVCHRLSYPAGEPRKTTLDRWGGLDLTIAERALSEVRPEQGERSDTIAGPLRRAAPGETAGIMPRANRPGIKNTTRSGELAPRDAALVGILAVILEVRRDGLSFRQMGSELVRRAPAELASLGYSQAKPPGANTCHRWTRAAFETERERWRETSDDTKRMVEERLDAVIRANWAAMESGDVAAGRLILATEDRRAKLLGLDKREDKTDLADAIAELVRARVGQDGRLAPALPSPTPNDVVDMTFDETEPSRTERADASPDDHRA